ncbi:hypothetical protein [uncultured Croceitalea sp.]|uniref:hypothetical protein n=1 Tax=uncultured Croceitalea sp. TaxID=1798908 RepID=UPI0033064A5B
MGLFKRVFDFYLDASIHVAFSVLCLYLTTLQLLETSTNCYLAGFLFFGTIVCYNFIKYGVEAEKYVIVSNPYHRIIQVFSFLCFVAVVYFFLKLDVSLWSSIFLLTALSGLYAVPFLGKHKSLRNLGGLKVYLVALVWAGCTVYLPTKDANLYLTNDFIILLLQQFLLVLLLLLPFEIRDMRFDAPDLRTLPQRLGIERTKKLGYCLVVLFLLLLFFKDDLTAIEIRYRLLLSLLVIMALFLSKKERTKYYTLFWVESIPIILYFLVWKTGAF